MEGTDQDGENVMHLCASEGQGDILNAMLIKAKKDASVCEQVNRLVNAANKEGNAPLHLAALEEKTIIINLLVQASHIKVEENKENKAGLTYK